MRIDPVSASKAILAGMVLSLAMSLTGCGMPTMLAGPGGKLSISNQVDHSIQFKRQFDRGYYSFADRNELTIVLIEGEDDSPRRALTMRVFWQPRAAHTPIDPSATNATVHYYDFVSAHDVMQLGVYNGAGYVYPYDELGADRMQIGVWEASLKLEDHSPDFVDELGSARLQGKFIIKRDSLRVQKLLHTLSVRVREELGHARQVRAVIE